MQTEDAKVGSRGQAPLDTSQSRCIAAPSLPPFTPKGGKPADDLTTLYRPTWSMLTLCMSDARSRQTTADGRDSTEQSPPNTAGMQNGTSTTAIPVPCNFPIQSDLVELKDTMRQKDGAAFAKLFNKFKNPKADALERQRSAAPSSLPEVREGNGADICARFGSCQKDLVRGRLVDDPCLSSPVVWDRRIINAIWSVQMRPLESGLNGIWIDVSAAKLEDAGITDLWIVKSGSHDYHWAITGRSCTYKNLLEEAVLRVRTHAATKQLYIFDPHMLDTPKAHVETFKGSLQSCGTVSLLISGN
ncbi:hypothetical protein Bbelb_020880 [Branchiostoma belcheri]|nr:hypothetical protein Bbelb_020880 [Branchiostoma belcheri]